MAKHNFDDGLPNWLIYLYEIILIGFLLFAVLGEFAYKSRACKDFDAGCLQYHLFGNAEPILIFFIGMFMSIFVISIICCLTNIKKYPKNTITLSLLGAVNSFFLITFASTETYFLYKSSIYVSIVIAIAMVVVSWKIRKK